MATLAGGCFWCTEAIFARIKGVISVLPGYTGGTVENPSYEQVCSGRTGHAEALQIEFDKDVISFEKILEIFWYTHDPTTLNRQGADVGTQYRSAIFYHDEEQKKLAEASRNELKKEGVYENKIVTEIVPLVKFFPAEEYHKNYFERNSGVMYCSLVIKPKLKKLMEKYSKDIKEEYKS